MDKALEKASWVSTPPKTPELTAHSVLDACSDCDTCHYLMDESCMLTPKFVADRTPYIQVAAAGRYW